MLRLILGIGLFVVVLVVAYFVAVAKSTRFRLRIARLGAVGGTARWAAKTYRFFRCRCSEGSSDSEIFRDMISLRYRRSLFPNARYEQYLLSRVDEVNGLTGLVIEILKVDASLWDNRLDFIYEFIQIVVDELRRSGLPPGIILGDASGVSDYLASATEAPRLP